MKRINKNTRFFIGVKILFWAIIFPLKTNAQDTLVKRNNDKILVKIVEVNNTEIKYRFADYTDGPLFVVPKWELKNVTYGNGIKESFDSVKPPVTPLLTVPKKDLSIMKSGKYYIFKSNRITELDMLDVAQTINDKKLNLIIKRTKEIRFTRRAFSAAAIAAGSFGFLTYVGIIPIQKQGMPPPYGGGRNAARNIRNVNTAYRHTIGGYFMLGAVLFESTSLIINLDEIKHAHLVVKVYNSLVGG
jgi:hypothetical protein